MSQSTTATTSTTAGTAGSDPAGEEAAQPGGCCDTTTLSSCCEPTAKSACCGAPSQELTTAPATCGCS